MLPGACPACEIVQGGLECASLVEIAHLTPMIRVTCQNPDPHLFAVTGFLTAVDS